MARTHGDITVTLSVLDRLIDEEPGSQVEAPLTRSQSVRKLKQAVQRDLLALLNTRRIFELPDESLTQVNRSVYLYGLPDFSSYSMNSSTDQAKLVRQVLATLKMFEPRLANIRIIPGEPSEAGFQQLRLRIEALLVMEPSAEPVSFETVIELKSGACRIAGGANAG
jgi:type VI secretion system protein ImpF